MVAASVLRRHGSEAAGAARLKVGERSPHCFSVVLELPQGEVAFAAQQSAVFPGGVAVVQHQPTTTIILPAKVASERQRRAPRLLFTKPVTPHQIVDGRSIRRPSILSVLRFAALSSILGAILPHPPVFTKTTRRFAAVLRDVVEPKIRDGVFFATPGASLRFHSKFRSRKAGFRRAENML